MLDLFGRRVTRNCEGTSRRDFIRVGAAGMLGLTLADLLRLKAQGQTAPEAKAKSVIQLWMSGGPTQTDTFDPKPDAGEDYAGPLRKPLQTNVPGIKIGERSPCWPSRPTNTRSFAASRTGTTGTRRPPTSCRPAPCPRPAWSTQPWAPCWP